MITQDTQLKRTQDIRTHLLGKQIQDISLFNINDPMFETKDCDRQFFDGGLSLHFVDGSELSLGWSEEDEFHQYTFAPFETLYPSPGYYHIPTKTDHYWTQIRGTTILDLDVEWNWYVYPNGRIYTPAFLRFNLSNGLPFFIGIMDFDLERRKLVNFRYVMEGMITVCFDAIDIQKYTALFYQKFKS